MTICGAGLTVLVSPLRKTRYFGFLERKNKSTPAFSLANLILQPPWLWLGTVFYPP